MLILHYLSGTGWMMLAIAGAAAQPGMASTAAAAMMFTQDAQPGAAGTAQTPQAAEGDPLAELRAPLLREGTTLIEARGHLRRDEQRDRWLFVLDRDSDASRPAAELVLMPCTRLAEMVRMAQSTAGSDLLFVLSGRVYLYGRENFVLPTHVPVVAEATDERETLAEGEEGARATQSSATQPPEAVTSRPSAIGETSGNGSADSREPTAESAAGDSVEDIMRELDRETGPLMRSSAPAADSGIAPATQPDATTVHTRADALEDRPPDGRTVLEDTMVVGRRGKITRDRNGGWMIVFDADASGLGDPPMRLLPCMLLERIEGYARSTGNNSPVVMTGQVFLFQGQNYLLPTLYRIPRERSRLIP